MTRTMRVVTIQPDSIEGVVETVEWDLDWIKSFVGGWIEHITISRNPDWGFYINEEGKILDPPLSLNRVATAIYRRSRGIPGNSMDPRHALMTIEGPAVLVGGPDEQGNEISLNDWDLVTLRRLGIIS